MINHRRFRRIPFNEALGFEGSHYESFKGSLACDLSEGGVRVRSERFMPLGTSLRTRFQLDNMQVITLMGKVVWAQKEPQGEYYQMGVEFEEEDENLFTRRSIHDYIDEKY